MLIQHHPACRLLLKKWTGTLCLQ